VQVDVVPIVAARQTRLSLEQVELVQQGCPSLPQATHDEVPDIAVWHSAPLSQVPATKTEPPQHGWLGLPHSTQVPVVPTLVRQVVSGAVQRLLEQQGSPTPPQLPHAPSEQVPPIELPQVLPDAVQVGVPVPVAAEMQQPPSAQKLPSQQAWLAPPQAVQVPLPNPVVVQVVRGAVQVELAQQ
jgi:hypothetical protein